MLVFRSRTRLNSSEVLLQHSHVSPRRGGRRRLVALLGTVLMLNASLPVSLHAQQKPPSLPPAVYEPLREALQKSYYELFDEAPRLEFSESQISAMRKYLDESRDQCVRQFKRRAEELGKELQATQASLKESTARLDDAQRKEKHCKIQNLRALESQARVLAEHAIPVAYENRKAKLDLIQKWPDELKRIKAEIAAGTHNQRKWGDVKDIG